MQTQVGQVSPPREQKSCRRVHSLNPDTQDVATASNRAPAFGPLSGMPARQTLGNSIRLASIGLNWDWVGSELRRRVPAVQLSWLRLAPSWSGMGWCCESSRLSGSGICT